MKLSLGCALILGLSVGICDANYPTTKSKLPHATTSSTSLTSAYRTSTSSKQTTPATSSGLVTSKITTKPTYAVTVNQATSKSTTLTTQSQSSPHSSCISTTVSTTTIATRSTTITYAIDSASTTIYTYESFQGGPETVFVGGTTELYVTFPTTTTVLITPTTFVGPSATVTIPTPPGFRPIRSSLPGATADPDLPNPVQKRDVYPEPGTTPVKCTKTFTRIVTSQAPERTATAVTTLSGTDFIVGTTIFDGVGLSSYLATYTGPVTVTSPGTYTTTIGIYNNAITSTVTLPTQTIRRVQSTVYAACGKDNIANKYFDKASQTNYDIVLNSALIYFTKEEFQADYNPQTAYDCCVMAHSYPNISNFQWSPFEDFVGGRCFLTRTNQTCVKAGDPRSNIAVANSEVMAGYAFTGNIGCSQIKGIEVHG